MSEKPYDVFISHASEDKESLVAPLAAALRTLGVKVWYDEFELTVGDSLSRKIDHGLAKSRFGLVVISPAFLKKNWPEYELRGLISREIAGEKVILPIWHNVAHAQVMEYSPPLADKLALNSEGKHPVGLTRDLVKVIRPDIYQQILRTVVAKANALKNTHEINIEDIYPSPPRHATLPQHLMARVISIHAMTEDVLSMSFQETVDSFRSDYTPESEIRIWERIAACFYIATTGQKFSEAKRKDIFAVLLAASLGPVGETEYESRGTLDKNEIDSLIKIFDSNLSEVKIQRRK